MDFRQFSFSGKAARPEFWGWWIATTIGYLLLFSLDASNGSVLFTLGYIFFAAWIQLATAIRRCTDAGITPWFSALLLIPYVNLLIVLILGIATSTETSDD